MSTTTVSKGDKVLITGPMSRYGRNAIVDMYKARKIYAEVIGVQGNRVNIGWKTVVPEDKNSVNWTVSPEDIQILSEAEVANDYQPLVESFRGEINNYSKLFTTNILTVPTENYLERDFTHVFRNRLHSAFSFATTGNWDQEKGTFAHTGYQWAAGCCSFTRVTRDLTVYIPKVWLNYYGYTRYDLVEWLKFLTRCCIGFQYEFEGEVELPEGYRSAMGSTTKEYHTEINSTGTSTFYPAQRNTGWYGIKIKGDKAIANLTYARFICVRYMFNTEYWSIPGTAMQIKRALGSKVSHTQALLMAHLRKQYNGYYALVGVESGGTGKIVDPFQDALEAVKRMEKSSMNNSWTYFPSGTFSYADFEKFFAAKDWEGLYNFIKEKTKK